MLLWLIRLHAKDSKVRVIVDDPQFNREGIVIDVQEYNGIVWYYIDIPGFDYLPSFRRSQFEYI